MSLTTLIILLIVINHLFKLQFSQKQKEFCGQSEEMCPIAHKLENYRPTNLSS